MTIKKTPVRANGNGRTVGHVEYDTRTDLYIWRDDLGVASTRTYECEEDAGMALGDAYWAAAEEFGRDAHASQARI